MTKLPWELTCMSPELKISTKFSCTPCRLELLEDVPAAKRKKKFWTVTSFCHYDTIQEESLFVRPQPNVILPHHCQWHPLTQFVVQYLRMTTK